MACLLEQSNEKELQFRDKIARLKIRTLGLKRYFSFEMFGEVVSSLYRRQLKYI